MIEAKFSSRSFEFTAYGKNKTEASKILLQALSKHGKEYQLDKRWYTEMNEKDSEFLDSEVNFKEIQIGCAFRDYDKLI